MAHSTEGPALSPPDRAIALALGLLTFAVYLATSPLRFRSIDEIAVFSVARSLSARGAVDADILYWSKPLLGEYAVIALGVDGHAYTIKDVAPSILLAPLLSAAHVLDVSPVRAAMLFSPLITAITASLIYHVLRSWGCSHKPALLGGLVFALGSLA